MANISDANGTVTLRAKDKDELEKLVQMLDKTRAWEYGIVLERDDTSEITERNEWLEEEIPFYGYGRWDFISNLENLARNLSYEVEAEFLDTLEKIMFQMEFQYIDFESGCRYFCEDEVLLIHNCNTPLTKTEVSLRNKTHIPFTPENIMEYGKSGFCFSLKEQYVPDIIKELDLAEEAKSKELCNSLSLRKELCNTIRKRLKLLGVDELEIYYDDIPEEIEDVIREYIAS